MSKTLTICLLAACALGPLQAEEPAKPNAPAIHVERSLYIPYEKLEAVFEKEGRGIFLPYEEFLKLWTAAQPPPKPPAPDVPPAAAVIRGGTYTGTVAGGVARLEVTYTLEALAKGWSEVPLPFKDVAIEGVELSSPKALFSTKGGAYALFLPEPGHYQAKLAFSVRVAEEPGRKRLAFGIPPTAVSRLDLTIPEEEARVDVAPSLAVTQTTSKEKTTRVLAFLGNSSEVTVSWMPPLGKVAEEGAMLFAEQSLRVHLGERIVKISTEIACQVLRGQLDTLRIRLPEGTRLLAVKGENIRQWAEEGPLLVVALHSPVKDAYHLALSFERILEETPPTLAVPFPRVEGVTRESGWVVLGHEANLNLRINATTSLSQLDRDEVPEPLRAGLGTGFRYLAQPLALELAVEKILPVIRSFTTSVVTLGREEDSWTGWLDFAITKAGVFRLEIRVPARWSVASMGDPNTVEDFQTADAAGVRTVTVNLKSKALGSFRLPFRLVAEGSAAPGEATLAPPLVGGSIEDRGLFGVNAPRALELSTVERQKMTSADVDELFHSGIMTQIGAEAGIPLAYGYRDQPASIKLRLVAKATEVDLLAQHLIEIGDGRIKATHFLDFEILFAATDRLTITAPASLDNVLKIEAKEKKEFRKLSTADGRSLWEIILQTPALGTVSITLNHELELKALESGRPFLHAVPFIHGQDVRGEKGFVALRKEGTLEIVPQPTGMEALDAGDLPDKLRRGQIYSSFRYFAPNPALALNLTRYDYQQLATTVVSLLRLESVLSEERRLRTRATLFVQNTERQFLELNLAPEAILSLSVSGKAQLPRKRKEGTGTLIQIPPSAGAGGTFPVTLIYEQTMAAGAMGVLGSAGLATPEVLDGVPVSKIELDLYLPPDYQYLAWRGNLKPADPQLPGLWSHFKDLLHEATGSRRQVQATSPPARPPEPAPAAVEMELPTRGYVPHRFETMAPKGELRFVYVGRNSFSFVDFLAFAAAVAAGFLLRKLARWPLSQVAVALILAPLVAVWFTTGALVEIFSSLLAGGAAFFLATGSKELLSRLRDFRAARLAMAPDPYLEEAAKPAAPPAPAPSSETPAPSETPTTAPKPRKAGDSNGQS